jgi:hypothetical protein
MRTYNDKVILDPNELHFIWSSFVASLNHNVKVNYARKCHLRQVNGELKMLCDSEAVREFAVSRWQAELDKAFMCDVKIAKLSEDALP